MNSSIRTRLLAERTSLLELIADTDADDVIDLYSLQSRLSGVDEELAKAVDQDPASVNLTFSGKPVFASFGIVADFGMKAVTGFTDAVAAVAASLTAPLKDMGPIPGKHENQLLITGTARGSFGFQLQETPGAQLVLHEPSAVKRALDYTQHLLMASVNNDDEGLADAVAELDTRAIAKVRAFVTTLATNGALCAIQVNDRTFRFSNSNEVQLTLDKVSPANIGENHEELTGQFVGCLAHKGKTFEFLDRSTGEVIAGKIGPAVETPEAINNNLYKQCVISVMTTRVGDRRPRYLLLKLPNWPEAQRLA